MSSPVHYPTPPGHSTGAQPHANRLVTVTLCGKSKPALMPRVDGKRWPYTMAQLRNLAASDKPLLLTGETGTGKELLAHYLHEQSRRGDEPLIAVNCSMFTPDRLQGELFGWRKGAFSGAIADHPGFVADAKGGTLFLDEIGNLDKSLQGMLLRLLQSGEYQPLGTTMQRADVRVIAATSKPEGIVEDLCHRFALDPLALPALRDRGDDVFRLLLLPGFLDQTRFTGISLKTLCRLVINPWPGNMRDLNRYCERQALKYPGVRASGAPPRYILDDPMTNTESGEWDNFVSFALARLEKAWLVRRTAFHSDRHIANTARLLLSMAEYDDPFALGVLSVQTLSEMLADAPEGKHKVFDFRLLNEWLQTANERLEHGRARKGGDCALPGALVLIRDYATLFAGVGEPLTTRAKSTGPVSEEFEKTINGLAVLPCNPPPSAPAEPVVIDPAKTRKHDPVLVEQVLTCAKQGLGAEAIRKQINNQLSASQIRGIERTHRELINDRPRNKGGRPRKNRCLALLKPVRSTLQTRE